MISRVGRLDSESSDGSLKKEQIVFQLIHKADYLRYTNKRPQGSQVKKYNTVL
jgi:hypothetical protein